MDSIVRHSYSVESQKLAKKMSDLDKIIFFKREKEETEFETKLNRSKENWGRSNSPCLYTSKHTELGTEVTDLDLGILDMQPVAEYNKNKKIELTKKSLGGTSSNEIRAE